MWLRRGLDVRIAGKPRQEVGPCTVPPVVGLLGSDYPGLRLRALVAPGDAVAAGDPVLADRHTPELLVTAPAAGVVEDVGMGPKRRISALTIRLEGDAARRFSPPEGRTPDRDAATQFLMECGLWAAFLRRPFGKVPEPGTAPEAIFVTATDSEPNAADPAPIVTAAAAAFERGVHFLAALTEGPVFVCQARGAPLLAATGQVRVAEFAGPHPAGLPGTHIDRLLPASGGRSVWQIGAQDVIALGRLLETGRIDGMRTVALGGPSARDPRLVQLPLGADIETLAATETSPGPRRVLSGSALSGVESRFLRRRHTQVTLLPRPAETRPLQWLPGQARPPKRPPLVPHAALDAALGPGLPVIPLLRALSIGDAEQAARLGARALLEEDLALATYISGGTEDFGARLRAVLDKLEGSA